MVADDDGNLFIISARNQVFKVNVETKVATHLGAITGLPANYTSNGAAVTDDNKILISSAVDVSSFFVVDPKNWSASAYKINGEILHTSDLGNGNILITKQTTTQPEIITRAVPVDQFGAGFKYLGVSSHRLESLDRSQPVVEYQANA